MPYKFTVNHIHLPKEFDRRIKLSNNDRKNIKEMYENDVSIRNIARTYVNKCSRRLIQFVLFPKRYERMLKLRYAKNEEYYERMGKEKNADGSAEIELYKRNGRFREAHPSEIEGYLDWQPMNK